MSVALDTTVGRRASRGLALSDLELDEAEEQGWLVLKQRDIQRGDSLREAFGLPGLWRSVPIGSGRFQRVFELPPSLSTPSSNSSSLPSLAPTRAWARDDVDVDPDRDLAAELLDWASATAQGRLDGEPELPTSAEIDLWVPPERRRIRAGSQVAQVEVRREPGRVALQVPTLVRIPRDLPASRQDWLASLLRDLQSRWRLVRFGIDDEGARVRAEVDLTGAPTDGAPALFELALAALQTSASWALPGLAIVTDPSVESRMLDRTAT